MLCTTPCPRPRSHLREWSRHRGPWPDPATLCFPAPHIQLVTLPFLPASELCSDACAGPGASPFSGWLPRPLPVPHHDGSLTAMSPLSTVLPFWL